MTSLRLRARHYATGNPIELEIRAGQIAALGEPGPGPVDLEGSWVAPGLFDLQMNGCAGISFNSGQIQPEDIHRVLSVCRQHGIVGLCPTLITNSFEALHASFATMRGLRETDAVARHMIPGFHLEGPYLSPKDGARGAHPREHIRPPCWEEFCRLQEAAGGAIRLVTLAPEYDDALRFIEQLTTSGVVVALGHTTASTARIREAVQAGARLATHLGNGCEALLPRHDNPLWAQLAEDQLWASLICDGHHLPPTVLRCMLRAKTPARAVLTCDASSLAGLPPGRYVEWGQELEVHANGKVSLADTPFLAGSGVFTDDCLKFLLQQGETTLIESLAMASTHPRSLLQLSPQTLEAGQPADLILFEHTPEEPFRVTTTLVAGVRG